MDLSRPEYPSLLNALHPQTAATCLNDRLRVIQKTNTDIADFLKERRMIEELYITSLRKLARRSLPDAATSYGILTTPWQKIVESIEELANSHEILAQKIEIDVETPLRSFQTKNREMQSMSNMQGNLQAIAKEVEAAQKKVVKIKDKGSRAAPDKVAAASTQVEDANQQWQSQAPYVFEQLQAVDEMRINQLRDLLTQLETHELDQAERFRASAEAALNSLLNIETRDEILAFTTKVGGPNLVRRESTTTTTQQRTSAEPSTPAPEPPIVETPTPSLRPPTATRDDASSLRSEQQAAPSRDRLAPLPPPAETPSSSKPGGRLRRLGTVLSRRKSVIPPGAEQLADLDKEKRSPFSSFKKTSSHDAQNQRTLTPIRSTEDERPSSSVDEAPATAPAQPRITEANEEEPADLSATNGFPQASLPTTDSDGFSQRPSTIDEITRTQQESAALSGEDTGMNLTIRDTPIQEDESEAQQALSEMTSKLRMQAQQSGINRNRGTLRGRRDVRNTVFIPSGSPQLSELAALGGPQSPAQASPQKAIPPNTYLGDNTQSDTNSIRSSHTMTSRAGSQTAGVYNHHEMSNPGFNASLFETLTATFSEGVVTSSSISGELALAYNPDGGSESPIFETIRLSNFAVLEKVAANPAFVKAAGLLTKAKENESGHLNDATPGTYEIALNGIPRSMPVVAFKYQLHLDPAMPGIHSPLLIHPAWNLEEFQASVAITYTLNPAWIPQPGSIHPDSVTLKNVLIHVGLSVHLDTIPEASMDDSQQPGAPAIAALMHPANTATFKKKSSAVVWKIPTLTLTRGASDRVLARFKTAQSWPKMGKVDGKFEITEEASTGFSLSGVGSGLGVSILKTASASAAPDPFADEGNPLSPVEQRGWVDVESVRRSVNGTWNVVSK